MSFTKISTGKVGTFLRSVYKITFTREPWNCMTFWKCKCLHDEICVLIHGMRHLQFWCITTNLVKMDSTAHTINIYSSIAVAHVILTGYILDNLRKIFLIFLYVTQCKVLFSLLSIYKLHILVILLSLSRTLHAVDHHNILSPPFALYTTHLSAPSFPEIVSYSAIWSVSLLTLIFI